MAAFQVASCLVSCSLRRYKGPQRSTRCRTGPAWEACSIRHPRHPSTMLSSSVCQTQPCCQMGQMAVSRRAVL